MTVANSSNESRVQVQQGLDVFLLIAIALVAVVVCLIVYIVRLESELALEQHSVVKLRQEVEESGGRLSVVNTELQRLRSKGTPNQHLRDDQPPRISLKESDGYSFQSGSAELSGPFRERLFNLIVPQILKIVDRYGVNVVEVMGHTDQMPLRGLQSNLDAQLIPFLRGENVQIIAHDNVGLGMARAAAVVNALAGDSRVSHLTFLPYSAGQAILRGDRLSTGDRQSNAELRRIEISLRKPR